MRTRMSGGVGGGRAILPATRLAVPGVIKQRECEHCDGCSKPDGEFRWRVSLFPPTLRLRHGTPQMPDLEQERRRAVAWSRLVGPSHCSPLRPGLFASFGMAAAAPTLVSAAAAACLTSGVALEHACCRAATAFLAREPNCPRAYAACFLTDGLTSPSIRAKRGMTNSGCLGTLPIISAPAWRTLGSASSKSLNNSVTVPGALS